MVDTVRSRSEILALLPDNITADITPQDVRDMAVSLYAGVDGTLPVLGDFVWVNQGGATVNDGAGWSFLRAPVSGGDDLRVLKKAAPGTPYTITALMRAAIDDGAVGAGVMLLLRESGSGKLESIGPWGAGNQEWLVVGKWDAPNNLNGWRYSDRWSGGGQWWFRISDDGANKSFSYSLDGVNFTEVESVGRTNFMTADEVGFAVSVRGNLEAGLSVMAWDET